MNDIFRFYSYFVSLTKLNCYYEEKYKIEEVHQIKKNLKNEFIYDLILYNWCKIFYNKDEQSRTKIIRACGLDVRVYYYLILSFFFFHYFSDN